MSKLLLIEHDEETAVEVVGELTHRGYVVDRAATGTAGSNSRAQEIMMC